MIVELTKVEMFVASQAGCMRRINSICNSLPEPYGTPDRSLFDNDVDSCGAEMAVAKAFGVYWNTFPVDFRDLPGDVANVEVRSTKHLNGHLIVHDRDKDDRPFVLVRGTMPKYELAGWIMGKDAKQSCWIRKARKGHAYFVPADQLREMKALTVTPQKEFVA